MYLEGQKVMGSVSNKIKMHCMRADCQKGVLVISVMSWERLGEVN